jgi:hypothetical protein
MYMGDEVNVTIKAYLPRQEKEKELPPPPHGQVRAAPRPRPAAQPWSLGTSQKIDEDRSLVA